MFTIAALGVASSLATEAIRWLDKKLVGTPIEGRSAFFLSLFITALAAVCRVAYQYIEGYPPFHEIWLVGTEIFAYSQLYFQFIAKTFGLRVQTPSSSTPLL